MTIIVGKFNPDAQPRAARPPAPTTDARRRRPREGRRPRRRPLLRARGLARLGRVGARGAAPRRATRSSWVELGARRRRGRATARSSRCAPAAGCSAPTSSSRSCTGPFGEDGTVQGLLELLDVPYVGAGVLASALCMDKVVFKDAHGAAPGCRRSAYWSASTQRGAASGAGRRVARLGYPCWVKPARLGSSVGIARVDDAGRARGGARGRVRPRPAGDRRGERARASRSSARCSGRPTRRRPASRARSCSPAARTAGTTTRPSTRRAAWSSSCPRGSPTRRASACASWPSSAFRAGRLQRPGARRLLRRRRATCCSTSSTRCPASRRRASTAKLWEAQRAGLPASCATASCAIAVERFERERLRLF